MNVAQFWVSAVMVGMKVAGVAIAAPWDSSAPVAFVSRSAAEIVPVAYVSVEVAPVVVLVKMNPPVTEL